MVEAAPARPLPVACGAPAGGGSLIGQPLHIARLLQDVEAPKAATASRSVLAGIIGSPSAPPRYKVCSPEGGFASQTP